MNKGIYYFDGKPYMAAEEKRCSTKPYEITIRFLEFLSFPKKQGIFMSIFETAIILNSVESGNISRVGYAEPLRILEVEFKNGSRYRYKDVPPEIYFELIDNKSPGSFLSAKIRGYYETFKYEELPENKT